MPSAAIQMFWLTTDVWFGGDHILGTIVVVSMQGEIEIE